MSISYGTLATNGLAFTLALAYNGAISKTLNAIYPRTERGEAWAAITDAVILTLIVVIIVVVINHSRRIYHRLVGGPANAGDSQKAGDSGKAGFSTHGNAIIRLWEPPLMA